MSPLLPIRCRPARWPDRWAALQACWTLPDGTPEQRQRLLALQVASVSTGAWLGDLVLLLVAVTTVACDPHPPAWWPQWLGALLLIDLVGYAHRRWWPAADRARHAIRLGPLCWSVLAKVVVFCGGLGWFYLYRDDTLRIAVAGVSMGALCGGSLRRARLPQVGMVWVLAGSAIAVAVLLQVHRQMEATIVAAMLAYTVMLVATMLSISHQFVQVCRREFDAERQAGLLQLLLNDFEGASSDWFWECDALGRLTHASPRLAEVLRRSPAELAERPLPALLAEAGTEPLALQRLSSTLQGERAFRELLLPLRPGGSPQWWSLSGKPLHDIAGRVVGWRGVGVDVSAPHQHEQKLLRLARTDGLTGLSSRHGFNEVLGGLLGPTGSAQPVALMVLDLDRFKSVNDAHGHAIGDQLLQVVAARLMPFCGPRDCVARLGGDEFALVLPGQATAEALRARGEQLLQALRAPVLLGSLQLTMRASLGVACAPQHALGAADLQRAADIALYAAKHGGRDACCVYDQHLGALARTRAHVTQDLACAVAGGELRLAYQLIVDARSGQPQMAEALLRWAHPRHGLIAPADFIPLAEDSGQIVPIGTWVLQQACREAAGWPLPIGVAVNLSPAQLRHPQLVDDVAQALAASGLPPQRLELELTETALADDDSEVQDVLLRLRTLGVRLALDDFGTGSSSLARLQRHGFDRLKIDRAFVQPLTDAAPSPASALAGAIVGLARALGLPCTAEGVEHESQERWLRELGCSALQGFRYHRPVPAEALLLRLRDQPAGIATAA